ncbi:MAG: hypothetical protein K1X92_00710 [Bacteroidia bacterium]|nr:hypothetical protein [Bacteroidia bacterium]
MKYIVLLFSFALIVNVLAQNETCTPRKIERLSGKIISKLSPAQIASVMEKDKWTALEGELSSEVYPLKNNELKAVYDYVSGKGCHSFYREKAEDAVFSYVYFKIHKKDTCLSKLLQPEIEVVLQQQKFSKMHIAADSIEGIYIPRNLEDCFSQLDYYWDDTVKTGILMVTEEEFVGNMHIGTGMWLRNSWKLWSGSRLTEYFNYLGIHHPDDMSAIILASYHRYLSKKPVNLEEQIQFYQDYWKKTGAEEKKRLKKAKN